MGERLGVLGTDGGRDRPVRGRAALVAQLGERQVEPDGLDPDQSGRRGLAARARHARRGQGLIAVDALRDTQSKYRRKEAILIPDLPVYVLGEVRPGGVIGKPAPGSPNKTFVISYKTEEQRTTSNTGTGAWLLVGSLACFVFAAGFLFLAFMLRRF
jgi:hypothetical protein